MGPRGFAVSGLIMASSRDQRRMYGDLAWTWPIVSPPSDYVEEAEELWRLVVDHAKTTPRALLHLGCGGGHLDRTLKQHAAITGVDASEPMLELARALNPEVRYEVGDMRTVRLERTFDAVIVADSISYMRTEEDLRAAFRTAWDHLKPGGAFGTYAELTREQFRGEELHITSGIRGEVVVTLVEHQHDADADATAIDVTFVYLIRRSGDLAIETDRHVMGLFPRNVWRRLLEETGFRVTELDVPSEHPGGGMIATFACVRPARSGRNL